MSIIYIYYSVNQSSFIDTIMKIKVNYLASLAEDLGKTSDIFESEKTLRIIDIWNQLNPDFPIKANTICAINFEYSKLEEKVNKDSELAFFPPVTGG